MTHATTTRIVLAAFAVIFVTQGCRREHGEKQQKPKAAATMEQPASEKQGVAIGDAAPDFKDIIGIDDAKHGLADYKNAGPIVLVFTCNHCPVAVAYEDRLVALQKDYQPKGVQVVAVNVNNIPDDRLDKMKERAKQKGFSFPCLYDATQKMGRDYGAKVTPHVFVLDKDRKIAYMGAIDDNMAVDKVKQPHLRNALDALLDGKKPPVDVTKQFGCGIKYE